MEQTEKTGASGEKKKPDSKGAFGGSCLVSTVLLVAVVLGVCVNHQVARSRKNKEIARKIEAFRQDLVRTVWSVEPSPSYIPDPRYPGLFQLTAWMSVTFQEDGKAKSRTVLRGVGHYVKIRDITNDYRIVWGSYEGEEQPLVVVKIGTKEETYARQGKQMINVRTGRTELKHTMTWAPPGTVVEDTLMRDAKVSTDPKTGETVIRVELSK